MSLVLYCSNPASNSYLYTCTHTPGRTRNHDAPRLATTLSDAVTTACRPRPKDMHQIKTVARARIRRALAPKFERHNVRSRLPRQRVCLLRSPPRRAAHGSRYGSRSVVQRPRATGGGISASMDGVQGGGGLAHCTACSQSRGWHSACARSSSFTTVVTSRSCRAAPARLSSTGHACTSSRFAARRLSIGMSGTGCTTTTSVTRRKMTTIGAKLSSTLHRGMHGFRLGSGGSCAWPATQSCSFSLHRR